MPPKAKAAQTKQTAGKMGSINAADGSSSTQADERAAFTRSIVAALKDLERKQPQSAEDLAQQAYTKLQYDFPLVAVEELHGLATILRNSLQLKSGQRPSPLTHKFVENILVGARPPHVLAPRPAAAAAQAPGTAASPEQGSLVVASQNDSAAPGSSGAQHGTANGMETDVIGAAGGAASPADGTLSAGAPQPDAHVLASLVPAQQQEGKEQLASAYRSLCVVVFIPFLAHCLAVSEQEAWELLHAVQPHEGGDDEEEQGEEEGKAGLSGAAEPSGQADGADVADGQAAAGTGPQTHGEQGGVDDAVQKVQHALAGMGEEQGAGPGGTRAIDADDTATAGASSSSSRVYEEPSAAEEDGDDFVFEDFETPPGPSNTPAAHPHPPPRGAPGRGSAPSPPLAPAPPYAWPELRARLLQLSGHVSYALLDEQALWADGALMGEVYGVLRALGAHRHAEELQPLLHAYVGLVADRLAACPEELGALDALWDAVGLPCLAAMPQQVGRAAAQRRKAAGGGVLLAEASTCLSLVASLSGQLGGSAVARGRLWQQVHRHMLPLLERCLGELARGVTEPGAGARAGKAAGKAEAAAEGGQAGAGPGPGAEEVAAIVLVCQVLDFYVTHRPGNADLASALKSSGVLASLCRLFAAAGHLPGAEPLRGAALGCAASGRELREWMGAVPGVPQALAGEAFREGGPCEAHGAVWELMGKGGSSPTALAILSDGAAPGKAVRVHAFLQLLAKATTCQGGRGGSLCGAEVEGAMRAVFAALRVAQGGVGAAGAGAGAGGRKRGSGDGEAAVSRGEGLAGASGQAAGGGDAAGPAGAANGTHGGAERADAEDDAEGGPQPVEEDEDDEEDDKLHLLDPEALLRRRARQLHPVCWRLLKQLLSAGPSGGAAGKTD